MDNTPQPQETLSQYVKRIRTSLSLSQNDLATKAGIHLQSLGKIERGMTTKLNSKSQRGLARALQVPSEYLDAVIRGVPMSATDVLKFCPDCWTPGTTLEEIWLLPRSQFCFLCGTALRNSCAKCNEPITSLKFRFCPYCGFPYKASISSESQSQPL
ncbi:XRE family transcriptional regulator [Nostoc commune NIES-4072]|uniref:XRE family transcriptional regulator n=1 Tax=Nostoc commune NIES-4072 TaxID=2005467 RepID=A0A2R5G222_NOSCO|nr:zinc ribbon domain-containing protein [Nostoc commune]BBD70497.1 XRE family transcriptional regulator [Nostoc commune HK-02]BBD71016.1 XRE family transcriptional regulator [Nostoc commune HK-02]BBD71053.1 XRE family transcriptional regulator [Nostoc commune HK-02]GBG23152.1 XRE family transcriptional regulator [Nostoc commune NIES-4072]GBG23716.1 XRE family transcriptional regulator [Nostoc commune NIES-4072]